MSCNMRNDGSMEGKSRAGEESRFAPRCVAARACVCVCVCARAQSRSPTLTGLNVCVIEAVKRSARVLVFQTYRHCSRRYVSVSVDTIDTDIDLCKEQMYFHGDPRAE